MTATATRTQGKSGFVKEYLNDNPRSNPTAVNQAWIDAGMEGAISPSLVNKIRAELGLAGNLRGSKLAKKRRKQTAVAVAATSRVVTAKVRKVRTVSSRNGSQMADVEADIDRLLFKVMNLGNLPKVEESLRQTRRTLYVAK